MVTKNTNKKVTKSAAKSKTNVATKTTKKSKTQKVTKSDEIVLNAKADITIVEEVMAICSTCKNEKEQTIDNFSPRIGGGFRNICKPCQTKASLVWTKKRADYRKQYQRAVQLINLGIPAIVPNAKDWQKGDVLMTVDYTDKNGNKFPSREAEVVYSEMKQAQADARAELKAERELQNAELKAQRKAQRAERKAERDAEKAEAKAKLAEERAKLKAKRDVERAEKAAHAKAEREKNAVARAEAKAEKSAEKAEQKRIEREEKALARAETAKQKAIDKLNEVKAKAGLDKMLSAVA